MRVHADSLKQMRRSPSRFKTTRWAVYENKAMDSTDFGDMRFLAIGPKNTFKEPPSRYPDSEHGTGWAYVFSGWVNLVYGEIESNDQ